MYDDTEETPAPHNTASLDTAPTTHSIPELDSETPAGYSEDTMPQRDLAQLQEHFQQFQERLNQLGPTTNQCTHIEELAQLTKKLQQLASMLQPHPSHRPGNEPLHTVMQ